MEDMDNNEGLHEIPDEDLFMKEVIRNDADLYFLHHYLSEVYDKG